MKLLAYSLTFYLLLLSVVPCCTSDKCRDNKSELLAGAQQAGDHEQGDDDCGTCSPFFSCEGCATATVAFETLQFYSPPIRLLTVYTGYIQTSLPQVNYDFWQPPKLS